LNHLFVWKLWKDILLPAHSAFDHKNSFRTQVLLFEVAKSADLVYKSRSALFCDSRCVIEILSTFTLWINQWYWHWILDQISSTPLDYLITSTGEHSDGKLGRLNLTSQHTFPRRNIVSALFHSSPWLYLSRQAAGWLIYWRSHWAIKIDLWCGWWILDNADVVRKKQWRRSSW
jgi:hypothetical protein